MREKTAVTPTTATSNLRLRRLVRIRSLRPGWDAAADGRESRMPRVAGSSVFLLIHHAAISGVLLYHLPATAFVRTPT